VIQLTRITLLVGVAASLTAQTLSLGEMTLVTPATIPPTYMMNVILTTSNTAAGVQFDLQYDPTQLTVTVALGPTAIAASAILSTNCLPNNCIGSNTGPNLNPIPVVNGTAATAGQRVIITGCCSSSQTSGQTPPTANVIQDGVVATLTIQATAAATTTGQNITLLNFVGTTAGGNQLAATQVSLAVGVGNSDVSATGAANLYTSYLVGDVNTPGSAYPPASNAAPNFGTPGKLNLADLILMLQVATSAPGFTTPPTCSDLFDAMDAFPPDTATKRGGDGLIKLNDLIVILQRATNAPGFTVWPVRTSRGEVCTTSQTKTAMAVRPAEVQGTLVLGAPEGAGTGQDRVPVYVQGGRDLAQMAVGFSVGDQQSQLQFVSADAAPSLIQQSQLGVISAAWLQGLNVRAGQRVLLGYVVGPAGSAANLKVFGMSAASLSDNQEVGLDVSGAPVVQK